MECPKFYNLLVRNRGVATTQQTLTDVEPSLVDKYVTKDGSTIKTREADDGTVEEQCPSCGNWYCRIGVHWGSSSCQHPPISQETWQMCKGLMMGDGSLINRDSKNCIIEIDNTNLTFLEYIEHKFGWLASALSEQRTAQESANHLTNRKQGKHSSVTKPEDCYDGYRIYTRTHPVFNHFEQWWITGEKVFPQLNYTKPLLRMWWVSDGSLSWNSPHSCQIYFTSCNEGSRPVNIINSFKQLGFDCSLYGGQDFALPVSQTEDFFDYIGHDPVPGFEYKWAWQDRDRYDRLMKEGKEKHHTQTIE